MVAQLPKPEATLRALRVAIAKGGLAKDANVVVQRYHDIMIGEPLGLSSDDDILGWQRKLPEIKKRVLAALPKLPEGWHWEVFVHGSMVAGGPEKEG